METIRLKITQKLANTKFGTEAVQEKADLTVFKKRPTFRVLMGMILMGFSYILGWPAISALGVLSYTHDVPLLIAVGGPALYGVSHLVFLLGMYLAGTNYAKTFMKWVVRRMIERYGNAEKVKR